MFRIVIFAIIFAFHPVHVSVMSIEYSDKDEAFIGFLKVYYDDFLLDLGKSEGKMTEKWILSDSVTVKEIMVSYLDKRLNLFAGRNKLEPVVSGINLTGNELKLNLSYKMVKRSKEFRIYNSILTDFYNDQSNLVIFRYGKFEEGVKFTPEMRDHSFKVK